MIEQHQPPNIEILNRILGFSSIHVMRTLVKTGVLEQLRFTAKSLSELVKNGGYNQDTLIRILRFGIHLNIVIFQNDQYSLTTGGRYLLKDVPYSLYERLLLFSEEIWQKTWNNLELALLTNDVAFEQVTKQKFFDYLRDNPEYGEIFNKSMTVQSESAASAILLAYDFSQYSSICDIGGGRGLLLKKILLQNPHAKGILFDLEHVLNDHILEATTDRVQLQSGDFFEAVPTADLLIMKMIIHDWNDEKALKILQNCRKSMRENSKLLIIDRVVGEHPDLSDLFFDLHMLLLLGGKERNELESKPLLAKADLQINQIIPMKSALKIIEVGILNT